MPAMPSCIIEPIWDQFAPCCPPSGGPSARLPSPARPRSGRLRQLVQVLVFGCAYERIADEAARRPPCGAGGTSGSRPGVMDALQRAGARRLRPDDRAGARRRGGRWLHHQGARRGRAGRQKPGGSGQTGAQALDRRRRRRASRSARSRPRPTATTRPCWRRRSTRWASVPCPTPDRASGSGLRFRR